MLNLALMVFVRKHCTPNRGVLSNACIHAGLSSRWRPVFSTLVGDGELKVFNYASGLKLKLTRKTKGKVCGGLRSSDSMLPPTGGTFSRLSPPCCVAHSLLHCSGR